MKPFVFTDKVSKCPIKPLDTEGPIDAALLNIDKEALSKFVFDKNFYRVADSENDGFFEVIPLRP